MTFLRLQPASQIYFHGIKWSSKSILEFREGDPKLWLIFFSESFIILLTPNQPASQATQARTRSNEKMLALAAHSGRRIGHKSIDDSLFPCELPVIILVFVSIWRDLYSTRKISSRCKETFCSGQQLFRAMQMFSLPPPSLAIHRTLSTAANKQPSTVQPHHNSR